ncbi:16S rRNA (cytosine(1402)-N(4))-methyltransferase RsmH [Blattabacterium cuenoti]|uniref:16S rRNA (cytosine(1402)-N(4))-methyltransferase RsmH n=1 Tax=Blattabacterium cuenoti TaxID=1653831 RepID=UPI0021D15F7A|nr:16S rRNA (cytosine(1402)-N(4))-methyltransferase RsmH [Blattabacterium cuenoti]
MFYHNPVMLQESVKLLITNKKGIYVDATFGCGGHSLEILKQLNTQAILIAVDQDKESIKNNCIKDQRLHLFHDNFINIKHILKRINIKKISGLLVDLGFSSFQINNPCRGFSHQVNGILDMRMNQKINYSALHVINQSSEKKLFYIFSKYGEFNNPMKIVKKILNFRFKQPIITTSDLIHLFLLKKSSFHQRKKFLSKLFQAIRIEVNQEIQCLKTLLIESSKIILPGGRISFISYHSIEDRIIKYFIKQGKLNNIKINNIIPFKMIHNKVIRPNIEEIKSNPNSRSAKLRVAEKI